VPWATEDSISQCPFLQMTYTAENPHADGSAAPGARPHYRPPRHRDLPATSRTHDNWMAARQTSCRQQTAPPQLRCSKDVTAHPHRPGARPGRHCPVPPCSGAATIIILIKRKRVSLCSRLGTGAQCIKKKISFGTFRCFARDGTRTIVSGAARRAKVLLSAPSNSQPFARHVRRRCVRAFVRAG
jgi:hypothetical protein